MRSMRAVRRLRLRRPRLPTSATHACRVAAARAGRDGPRLCPRAASGDLAVGRPRPTGCGPLQDAPRTDVAVVFGAGLWDGEPSPYLAHRLDAAAALYRDGPGPGRPRHRRQQPQRLRRAGRDARLPGRSMGVPRDADRDSTTPASTPGTPASAPRRSSASTGPCSSASASTSGGRSRCVDAAGVDSYGVGVDATARRRPGTTAAPARCSRPARRRWTLMFQPDPRFLGPKEKGITRALASGER
jgi:hypothetical protein